MRGGGRAPTGAAAEAVLDVVPATTPPPPPSAAPAVPVPLYMSRTVRPGADPGRTRRGAKDGIPPEKGRLSRCGGHPPDNGSCSSGRTTWPMPAKKGSSVGRCSTSLMRRARE